MQENRELRQAWDFVEHTGRSIFLTGKAGTGKTTFLKTVVERSKKRSIVVAPTGVAAINAGGVTIHSFFQLSFAPYVPGTNPDGRSSYGGGQQGRGRQVKFDFSREKRKIIASLDLLIIDEISMVRSDLLDAVDAVLRRYRDRYQPFGGVQLLMIGDLQQLTPVVTPEDERVLGDYYDTPYFFGSRALAQIDYVTIQLERVYRQENPTFLQLLNHIREGQPTAADLQLLNSRCNPVFVPAPDEGYIRLTTHNQLANFYNESELRKLSGRPVLFRAEVKGTFPEYAYPTSPVLELKAGAQVMFVKNDPSGNHRYYNGRIGRITYVDAHKILVFCPGDADAIEVEPLEWENARYTLNPVTREIETDVQGTFRQYPLRLAWAITIHKSQGLTFEHAIIDAQQSFAPGQVYVALSRCKSLEGLVLASRIEPRAIISDQRVDQYIAHQEEAARQSIAQLPTLKEEYYRHLLLELFTLKDIYYKEEYLCRLLLEFFYNSHTDVANLHKRALEELRQQVVGVADKWLLQISQLSIAELHAEPFLQRVERSAKYFDDALAAALERPLELAATVQTGNKQAMKRFTDILSELRQAYTSRRFLLKGLSTQPFTAQLYQRLKQQSQLDAMEQQDSPARRRRKKAPATTTAATPPYSVRAATATAAPPPSSIPPQHLTAILRVVRLTGTEESAQAIKSLCPPDVTLQEVRQVLAEMTDKKPGK